MQLIDFTGNLLEEPEGVISGTLFNLLKKEIIIYFYPYSQKYIYELIPKFGKLETVPSNLDFLEYKII